jgi:hypothetical protein
MEPPEHQQPWALLLAGLLLLLLLLLLSSLLPFPLPQLALLLLMVLQ